MRILNSILPIDNFLTHRPEQGNSVILVQHTLEGLQVQELQDPSIWDEQADHVHDLCYSYT